jgi:anti-anti-sigma regulatory factor
MTAEVNQMVALEVDQPKNVLIIRYSGHVEPHETEEDLEQIRSGLTKLQSGFRLLVELTKLEAMDVACAPSIEKAMDLCNEKGVSIVVRVIPDPHRDIGLRIMSYFHYGGDVRILTCETLAQAAELLRPEA